MRYRANKKCHASANANAHTNRIRTKNNMFPSPSVGDININCFTFFPYKSIRDQIWPCCKKGQAQPRVIIWINLVVLEHPMLHTKFQGHRPFDSGNEDVLRFFTIYMHGSQLGHVTGTIWTNFHSPIPRRLRMEFGFNRPCGFRGDVWKCRQHTCLQKDVRGLPIL